MVKTLHCELNLCDIREPPWEATNGKESHRKKTFSGTCCLQKYLFLSLPTKPFNHMSSDVTMKPWEYNIWRVLSSVRFMPHEMHLSVLLQYQAFPNKKTSGLALHVE